VFGTIKNASSEAFVVALRIHSDHLCPCDLATMVAVLDHRCRTPPGTIRGFRPPLWELGLA